MEYKNLKKGDKILTKQLGTPISGELLESPKQGKGLKNIVLIFSTVPFFSEEFEKINRGFLYSRNFNLCIDPFLITISFG